MVANRITMAARSGVVRRLGICAQCQERERRRPLRALWIVGGAFLVCALAKLAIGCYLIGYEAGQAAAVQTLVQQGAR